MHKNINLIDTHAHLDFPQIYPRLSEVVKNAKLNNVKTMVCISTNLSKIDQIIKITDNYKNIYFSVGVHPNEVENDKDYLNILSDSLTNREREILLLRYGLLDGRKNLMRRWNWI